jgi:hypothetical protein
MKQENHIQNTALMSGFQVDAKWLQPFDEFVWKMKPLLSDKLKNIDGNGGFLGWGHVGFPSLTVKSDAITMEMSAFGFAGIFERMGKLEKFWISLYAFYHFVFDTKTYVRVEEYDWKKVAYLMNDFSYQDFKKQHKKDFTCEYSVSESIADALGMKKSDQFGMSAGVGYLNAGRFLRRWKAVKWERFSIWETTATIEPIVFYENDDRALERIKKKLLWKALNNDYVLPEDEKTELSLKTGEIFEYFTSTSLNPEKPNIEKTREFLRENGVDESVLTDAELEAQMSFVSGFLAHILK